MSIQAANIHDIPAIRRQRTSPVRKALLYVLLTVLLVDMGSGLGIGIGTGLSGKNVLLYILVIAIGIQAVTNSRGLQFFDLDVHARFLSLIAYAMVTIFVASAFSPMYDGLRGVITLKNQLVDLYLFMFVYRYGIERRVDYVSFLRFIVVTMMFLSFISLIDFLNIPDLGLIGTHKGRIEGPFGSANQYGALLAFMLPITITTIRPNMRKWKKWLWWSGVVITAGLLLATGSRGAFVSTVVGSVIGVILLRRFLDMRQVARFAAIAFGLLVVFVIVFMVFNADLLLSRLEKTTSGNIYVASAGRLEIWTAALLIMLEWPLSFLVGNGWNSFGSSGIWKSAHNEYMDRFYELGIIGLALFVSLLFTVTNRVRSRIAKADTELRRMLIGYVFAMSIVVVNIFFSGLPDSWTIIWIVSGLILGLQATIGTELPAVETASDESSGEESGIMASVVEEGRNGPGKFHKSGRVGGS